DAMRERFAEQYALSAYDARQLTQSPALAEYFEATVRSGAPAKLAGNWIMGELARKLKELGGDTTRPPLSPERLAGLLALVGKGTITGPSAKAVFEKMFQTGRSADEIVAAEGLTQIDDDSAILTLVYGVLTDHADAVSQYKAGRTATFGFLVGQVMKAAA